MSSYCNVCRICLSVCGEFMDIFEFAPAIMECAPINIVPGDGFPSVICEVCLEKLQAAQHFRVLCIQSDIILRQSDKEVTIGIPGNNDEDYDSSSNAQDDDDDDLHNNSKSFVHFMTVDIEVENDVSFDCDTLEKLQQAQTQIYSPEAKIEPDTISISSNSDQNHTEEDNLNNHDTNTSPIANPNNKKSVKCKYKNTNHSTEHQNEPIVKNEPVDLNCNKCKKNFTKDIDLRRHKKKCFKVQKNKCACCNKIFKSRASYVEHFTNNKKCNATELCKICLKSFESKMALTLHYRIHKIKKSYYNCYQCCKRFRVRSQFLKHRKQNCKLDKHKTSKKKVAN